MAVLVVGAGPGGLALALGLARAGLPCQVYEARPRSAVSGGVTVLQPDAVRDLDSLGVGADLLERGAEVHTLHRLDPQGCTQQTSPGGRRAGASWPQLVVAHEVLLKVLRAALEARAGGAALRHDRRMVHAEPQEQRIAAGFEGGGELALFETVAGDALVGADGRHSTLRGWLHPGEAQSVAPARVLWSGCGHWAGAGAPGEVLCAGTLAGGRAVVWPLPGGADAQGRRPVYWQCERARSAAASEPGAAVRAGASAAESARALADFQAALALDWPDFSALLAAAQAPRCTHWAGPQPLPYWTDGLLTLLGDAAHPLPPGDPRTAGLALADARTLTDLLARNEDPYLALHLYDDLRRAPVARALQETSAEPDAVALLGTPVRALRAVR